MEKKINFDMDGTIANLYGVENWLDDLINSNPRPYEMAKPLVNMNILARYLNKLQAEGYEINIISWLAKNSTKEYDEKVAKAKKVWLKKHLKSVEFDNVYIVPYGVPKHSISNGILFDDEKPNRENWEGKAFDEKEILKNLQNLLTNVA